MSKRYAIGEFSKIVGRSIDTLRQWERDGVLTPERTKGNQRRYTEDQIREALDIARDRAGIPESSSIQSIQAKLDEAKKLIESAIEELSKISPKPIDSP